MNVHASLGTRIMAGDVPAYSSRTRLIRLLKLDGTSDFGVTTKECNCSRIDVSDCTDEHRPCRLADRDLLAQIQQRKDDDNDWMRDDDMSWPRGQ